VLLSMCAGSIMKASLCCGNLNTHQGARTVVPNVDTSKVQSQNWMVLLLDETGWSDFVVAYNTCTMTSWGICWNSGWEPELDGAFGWWERLVWLCSGIRHLHKDFLENMLKLWLSSRDML
jgi:hypothetical protein